MNQKLKTTISILGLIFGIFIMGWVAKIVLTIIGLFLVLHVVLMMCGVVSVWSAYGFTKELEKRLEKELENKRVS